MGYLSDKLQVVTLLEPAADNFDTGKTTSYFSMKNYKTAEIVINQGVGATGTSTITVLEASSTGGAGATAIPFSYRRVADTTSSDVPGDRIAATSAGFTITAGSHQKYIIEVESDQLDDGFPFVAINTVEVVNSPVAANIDVILGEPRYAGASATSGLV